MYYDGRVADCFRLAYDDGREVHFKNNGRMGHDQLNHRLLAPCPTPPGQLLFIDEGTELVPGQYRIT